MPSLKLHIVKGTNHGTESADFRGENGIGHEQGDEHRTLAEKDPASDAEVAEALILFPELNTKIQAMDFKVPAEFGGGEFFLRFGIWDH